MQNLALVEQHDALGVARAGDLGGALAQLADRERAVVDGVGGEVQLVGVFAVFEEERVGSVVFYLGIGIGGIGGVAVGFVAGAVGVGFVGGDVAVVLVADVGGVGD